MKLEQGWWVGVVEDRFDPEKLGRIKVRIIGIHSNDKTELPTSQLPWAIVMQPSTSASVSGIGTAPIGPLPGTWCVGFFMDGSDMQQPIVVGTLVGKPEASSVPEKPQQNQDNLVRSTDGSVVVDSFGNPIQSEPIDNPDNTSDTLSTLPPLKVSQIDSLKAAIGFKESSSVEGGEQNYGTVNSLGYLGKYQFGAMALVTLGYVKTPIGQKVTNDILDDPRNWVGKDNIRSKQDFLENSKVQEKIMFQNMEFNYKVLLKNATITVNDSVDRVAGLLSVSHLLGAGGATSFARGVDSKDGNGVTGQTYYQVGVTSVGGTIDGLIKPENNLPTISDPTKPLNDFGTGNPPAFVDPNGVYPKKDYLGRPDTNKLATGDSSGTIVDAKNKRRIEDVPIANSKRVWDEPTSAYGASYPYNQTFETEAGHVVEFDSSPGQERVHVYHKAGTYIEIDVNGTHVKKVVGDNFEIVENNNNLYVKGGYTLTADGVTRILVRSNADIEVFGKTTATLHQNFDLNIAGDFNVVAGGEFNVKSGGDINLAGKRFFADGSRAAIASGQAKVLKTKPPNRLNPSVREVPFKRRPDSNPNAFFNDSGEEGAEELRQEQIESGELIPVEPLEGESVEGQENNLMPLPVECSEFVTFSEFPDTIRLSKYFTLGQLSSKAIVIRQPVIEQRGLSRAQIVCNLKGLAVNCLDPIVQKYPDMFVTNAFRLPRNSSSGKSDHETGCAADIQFRNASPSDYFEIAKWIKDNVPFKQLLLEYGGGARNPWIHIAFNSGEEHPLKVATFKDHRVYARNQLINLA